MKALNRNIFFILFSLFLVSFVLTGCSKTDGDGFVVSEADDVGDDGGLPPLNDPTIERFYKEFDFAHAIGACANFESSERENCRVMAVRTAHREMTKRQNRIHTVSIGRTKQKTLDDIYKTHYLLYNRCENHKCRAERIATTVVLLDRLLYTAQQHADNLTSEVHDHLGQTCMRIKSDRDAVYVFGNDDQFIYTVSRSDAQTNQYTAVGFHKQSKKLLLAESTQDTDFLTFNGALVGFVSPDDLEEVKDGAYCEPVKYTYAREAYN